MYSERICTMATLAEPLPQSASSLCFEMKASSDHDDGLSAFANVRARLFGIAYHMLGSAAEAEDIVQDVWLRWQSIDRNVVQDAAAFLARTTTRLCINLAQSAHSRRETCVREWLPEPVDTTSDPALGAERGEALEVAVLVLLKNSRPQNAPHTFCTKPSITPTARLPASCRSKKPTPVNSSPVPESTSWMAGAHPLVRASSGGF